MRGAENLPRSRHEIRDRLRPRSAEKTLEATAPLFVFLWRRRIRKKHAHLIKQGLKWSEAGSTPYLARKPDHDGRRALVLARGLCRESGSSRAINLPETTETDPAYVAVSQNYFQSIVSILECHMFLPSAENFLIAAPDASGHQALHHVDRKPWRGRLIRSTRHAGKPTNRRLRGGPNAAR